ncbi:MAG: hypothetical protein FWD35_04825 [Oscillospiraceae bacterium]|nr:hypothetical protein [Oscillospiraceae bacterium]
MAFDTKVALTAAAQNVVKSKTLEEAYVGIAELANVEGVHLPSYSAALAKIEALRSKTAPEQ